MTVYFLIPIFNESSNIPDLHRELCSAEAEAQRFFVFSDDGSTDGSRELLASYFNKVPHIVLGDGQNRGPGYAFNSGFEWILEHSKNADDRIVTMEADCTSDINILPDMLAISKLGYQLVLASVYVQGGGFEKTTLLRKIISSVANLLYRFLFDIKIQTLSSFYRIYSIELLRMIKERYGSIITENGFICMLEILIKAVDSKARIIEVPMILASSKRNGASKLKIVRTTFHYLRFLLRVKRRPL